MSSSSTPLSKKENDSKNQHVSPLAFTVNFDEPNVRQLKIHDKLSSFALKHRRNPSLPDFAVVRNVRSPDEIEQRSLPVPTFVDLFNETNGKVKIQGLQNGTLIQKGLTLPRRSSMIEITKPTVSELDKTFTKETGSESDNDEHHNHCDDDDRDTVSEAGTYTVDKEEEKSMEFLNVSNLDDDKSTKSRAPYTPENHKWINDWISKVAEENFSKTRSVSPNRGNANGLRSLSPPIGTQQLPKTCVNFNSRHPSALSAKLNGAHRRSSSLSSKDFQENRKSDSSLETESFLKATEKVVTAMQNRMRLSETKKSSRKEIKERLHPPSTASDTDTNSEASDNKISKNIQPFTSARLNRAFSLRRARADAEGEIEERNKVTPKLGASKVVNKMVNKVFGDSGKRTLCPVRSTPSPTVQPKPNSSQKPKPTGPFTRVDGGRYSMRALPTATKVAGINAGKKETDRKVSKSGNSGGRSNSSLSAREVGFQNWKRRKSFDPMKAAAEGRKKEMAKKAAALGSSMTQSVHESHTSSAMQSGNPVLRSASFHSSIITHGLESDDPDEEFYCCKDENYDNEVESVDDEIRSPRHCFLPPNSPIRQPNLYKSMMPRGSGSRTSLNSIVSETMSSPTRQMRNEMLDNLVISAISDLSYKLKIKSCHLLRKLK